MLVRSDRYLIPDMSPVYKAGDEFFRQFEVQNMNPRERFVRVLTGKEVDRAPFIKVFGGANWVVAKWLDTYPHLNTYIDELLGFEGPNRGWAYPPVNMRLCGVPPDVVVYESETEKRVRHGDGSLSVQISRDGHFFNHITEYPMKCGDDWQKIKENWLNPDDPRRFPKGWRHYIDMYNARDYPLILFCDGVYGFIRKLFGDEVLGLMFYDDPGLVKDIINTYLSMCIAIWEKMIPDIQFDAISCWEDMSYKSGSIISIKHFDEFLAPHYRRIREFAEAAKIPIVLVDSDGNIMELAKWMYEAGVNCMFPFEVQSGNDIPRIRRELPGMGCIGGLNKECMAKDRAAMDAELDKARRLIPLGRYIPGPDHSVLENVPFENYEYFMRGLKSIIIGTGI